MKVEKKVIARLNKCYSIAELDYQGRRRFLVAAEKQDPCYLFEADGTKVGTVWEGPGGVMTMAQVPGTDGVFLATQRFYSPNDSAGAEIVIASPGASGWELRTLCKAPFVHRFGILRRGGVNWLLVCCLKSGHEYRDDWRFPGACYAAVLPDDLSGFDAAHPLPLTKLKDGMRRNHGYSALTVDGHDAALVGCEEGSFLFEPPETPEGVWSVRCLCAVPSSDSVLLDFDGDGKPELGCISPFHGNSLVVYHLDGFGSYVPCWKYPAPEAETEMLHATWAGELLRRPTWVVGWRKGTRSTVAIRYENGAYRAAPIDSGAGCANILRLENSDVLVAANRESDEIAMYTISE